MRLCGAVILGLFTLSACGEVSLRNLEGTGDGPDEFMVLPAKPLQQPASFTDLPEPTPGGTNLTDATPRADGLAALGGRPSDPNAGIPASDGRRVAHSGRFGNNSGIR